MRTIYALVAVCMITLTGPARGQSWTESDSFDCEKKGDNIRCGVMAYDWGANALIRITVKGDPKEAKLTYKEYHSVCYANSKAVIQKEFEVHKGQPLMVPMLSNGKLISCLEGWISECKKNGLAETCDSLFKVELLKFKGNQE